MSVSNRGRRLLMLGLLLLAACVVGAVGSMMFDPETKRLKEETERIKEFQQEWNRRMEVFNAQRDNLNRARDATQECFARQRKFQERAEKGEVPVEEIRKISEKEEQELAKALAQIKKSEDRLKELEQLATDRLTPDDLKLFKQQLEEDRISLEGWRWLANDLLKFWKRSRPR